MKNPKTNGEVRESSVRAGESTKFNPDEMVEKNLPTRKPNKNSKVLAPFGGGAIGWIRK